MSTVCAQAPDSGNDLLRNLKLYIKMMDGERINIPEVREALFSGAYVAGVADTMNSRNAIEIEGGTTYLQIARVVVKELEGMPKLLHKRGHDLLCIALWRAYGTGQKIDEGEWSRRMRNGGR